MNTLSQSVKNASVNDKITLKNALNIVKPIDEEREKTVDLLTRLEKQVGMTMGEEILSHIADMKGVKFNSIEYHYEKPHGEQ